jgi:hypothetical protein
MCAHLSVILETRLAAFYINVLLGSYSDVGQRASEILLWMCVPHTVLNSVTTHTECGGWWTVWPVSPIKNNTRLCPTGCEVYWQQVFSLIWQYISWCHNCIYTYSWPLTREMCVTINIIRCHDDLARGCWPLLNGSRASVLETLINHGRSDYSCRTLRTGSGPRHWTSYRLCCTSYHLAV